MNYKSFVDLLFILLLGTIVMLTESVPIGAVDVDLLRVGGGGVSKVRASEVELVIVDDAGLRRRDKMFADESTLARDLPADASVLLVVADGDVRFHRVMNVWSALSALGIDVELGAEPSEDGDHPRNRPRNHADDQPTLHTERG